MSWTARNKAPIVGDTSSLFQAVFEFAYRTELLKPDFQSGTPWLCKKDVFEFERRLSLFAALGSCRSTYAWILTYRTFYLAPGAERNIGCPVTREHSGRK